MYEVFRHYKGNHYLRLVSALHSEDLESYEVYRTLYDNPKSRVWARPTEMFKGSTDDDRPRFSLVGTVIRAFPEDEEELAAFGYDTWGKDRTLGAFIAADLSDPDTKRGERWFMQDAARQKVSVLNVLRLARGVVGIASVATHPARRGQGFASLLLRAVMELIRIEYQDTRFLLFAEKRPEMYERHGFRQVPDNDQHFKPALAMATGDAPLTALEQELLRRYF
jgi:GNAT superfamily N-acetyltransferase